MAHWDGDRRSITLLHNRLPDNAREENLLNSIRIGSRDYDDINEYWITRNLLIDLEASKRTDADARRNWRLRSTTDVQFGLSNLQLKAAWIIRMVQDDDQAKIYEPARDENSQQKYAAGPFLENRDLIEQTRTFKIAKHFPKGAHLHVHFNSILPAHFLVKLARNQRDMWIRSSCPLDTKENRLKAEIIVQVMAAPAKQGTKNLFESGWPVEGANCFMQYIRFLRTFPGGVEAAENWIVSKLEFTEKQTVGKRQTTKQIWDEHGRKTRLIKGFSGYESAFRKYFYALVKDMADDGICYAQLRITFSHLIIVKEDGRSHYSFVEICQIIDEEVGRARATLGNESIFGIGIIYCAAKLEDSKNYNLITKILPCIELKQKFPDLICGLDLVGPEETLQKISYYIQVLLQFKRDCKEAGVEIPFMFSAGETLQDGTETDQNLVDAYLLGSKRVGHGIALARQPSLIRKYKERGIAVEVCPISNEIMGLCPSIQGHALYTLLANGVRCTISSDNPTFSRSSLSHDFYQVLIGSRNSNLHTWKSLAIESIDSCGLPVAERDRMRSIWNEIWWDFLEWVIAAHPDEAQVWDNNNRQWDHTMYPWSPTSPGNGGPRNY